MIKKPQGRPAEAVDERQAFERQLKEKDETESRKEANGRWNRAEVESPLGGQRFIIS